MPFLIVSRTRFLLINVLKNLRKQVSNYFFYFRKKYAKVKKDLEDACKDVRGASMDDFHENAVPIYKCSIPSKATLKFVSNQWNNIYLNFFK